MRISVDLTSSTAEARDSVSQTTRALGEALGRLGETRGAFSKIDNLAFCLAIAHPLALARSARPSGSYHADTRTFYGIASLNYAAWIKPDWASRVGAVGLALSAATAAIQKTRITETERADVLAMIAVARRQAASQAPETMINLQSVELSFSPGIPKPMVRFGSSPFYRAANSNASVKLAPEKIDKYLRNLRAQASEPRPVRFKRYRRSKEGLDYHEVWPADGIVIEHWGRCGEQGQNRKHPTASRGEQIKLLNELKAKATALGFRPIPISRHAKLVVQRAVVGMGTLRDLDERHALEAFLDEQTGAFGLGHFDGRSIGSGSVEAVCFVLTSRLREQPLRTHSQTPGSPPSVSKRPRRC